MQAAVMQLMVEDCYPKFIASERYKKLKGRFTYSILIKCHESVDVEYTTQQITHIKTETKQGDVASKIEEKRKLRSTPSMEVLHR